MPIAGFRTTNRDQAMVAGPIGYCSTEDIMHPYDFSPLFRSTIGFERLSRLLNATLEGNGAAVTYPPYNIEKTGEDAYRITLAVAGFDKDDLDITVTDDTLVVKGGTKDHNGKVAYLHRGIAGRAFERRFELADHIRVADADLVNGLLNIDLVREVPEALKPRSIGIRTGGAKRFLGKAA